MNKGEPQRAIDALKESLNKYGKFSKHEMELYYFKKRLASFIPIYINEIKFIAKQIKRFGSNIDLQKKLNNTGKHK